MRSFECHLCARIGKGKSDRYRPIDETLPIPPLPTKNERKRQEVKAALRSERAALQKIAKATLASGRVKHDGDGLHLQDLRVEHKLRLKSKSLTISSQELDKGKIQAIDVFEIELQQRQETYYVLPQTTYYRIISILNILNDESPRD